MKSEIKNKIYEEIENCRTLVCVWSYYQLKIDCCKYNTFSVSLMATTNTYCRYIKNTKKRIKTYHY